MARRRSRFHRAPPHACLLLFLLLPTAGLAATPVLDEASRLITSGRAAEAEALLAAHELEYAGDARFDYVYGVALLDNGHRAAAIESFERALANKPGDPAARLELGRALYESGDPVGARRQFEWLQTRDAPARIRDVAQGFLRAMQPRRAPAGGWTSALEFGTGYDTNANAATDDSDFFGVTLDPKNVETSSAFSSLSFRVGGRQAVGERNHLSMAARLGHRWNENAGFVDQTLASLDTALEFGDGPTVFSLGAGGYYGLLDGDSHQWGANTDLGIGHHFAGDWLARGLLRYGTQRYDSGFGSLSTLDADRLMGAFSLWHAAGSVGYGLTAIAGHDDPRDSGSPYENDRYGLQFDADLRTATGSGLRFQIGWQDVDYADDPPFFTLLERSDEIWSIALGGEIRDWPIRGIHLLPRFGWIHNDSTISLYEYDRYEISLNLQRPF